ncbi:DUF4232 domain-containing protein [Streptomyces mexicanus]|uniref:DUF4232 domain-containing protein n=1 Tax=Streptomyces mexicanus TaxID=178566 RepID=A0A7X1HXQ8_9ACTN|nr:DUF4232 domain-containing protein [Streptomyces mexicanus]MBC2863823.1 DUF4232 domain-containing protein [Streptomyces mexicanus]
MRAFPITVAALAAALVLTACDNGGSNDDSRGDTGSKNTDTTACRLGDVALQVGPVSAAPAAGDTGNVPVTLTNQGAPCTLEGFPAVVLGAGSSTATVPADRTSHPEKLALAKGDTATFTLTYVRGGDGDGKSLKATSMKIAPPGTTDGKSFAWSYGPVGTTKTANTPDASVTAFQQAGD